MCSGLARLCCCSLNSGLCASSGIGIESTPLTAHSVQSRYFDNIVRDTKWRCGFERMSQRQCTSGLYTVVQQRHYCAMSCAKPAEALRYNQPRAKLQPSAPHFRLMRSKPEMQSFIQAHDPCVTCGDGLYRLEKGACGAVGFISENCLQCGCRCKSCRSESQDRQRK